ncbi:hypothetical protein JUNP479_3800 [Aeromonas jandaei]|nr:hypothetical protein JUNP479_3800 [Aeromonas jandaei]
MAQPLADKDADHGIDGVKEAHQKGAHLNLLSKKEAQGWHLKRYRHTGHEGDSKKRERYGIRASCYRRQQGHRITIRREAENTEGQSSNRMKKPHLSYVIIKSRLKAAHPGVVACGAGRDPVE